MDMVEGTYTSSTSLFHSYRCAKDVPFFEWPAGVINFDSDIMHESEESRGHVTSGFFYESLDFLHPWHCLLLRVSPRLRELNPRRQREL